MKFKPTVEQLATWAAMLDAKLSPDEAVRRALQLFEAADRLLRADEIADEKEEEELRAQYEDFTENFPDGRGLSKRI
jgi:citrate lyase beta subunit